MPGSRTGPGERHTLAVLVEYCRYFNAARPHQRIGQLVPIGSPGSKKGRGAVMGVPILHGLHHDYRQAA
jgi:hypothetical protein